MIAEWDTAAALPWDYSVPGKGADQAAFGEGLAGRHPSRLACRRRFHGHPEVIYGVVLLIVLVMGLEASLGMRSLSMRAQVTRKPFLQQVLLWPHGPQLVSWFLLRFWLESHSQLFLSLYFERGFSFFQPTSKRPIIYCIRTIITCA